MLRLVASLAEIFSASIALTKNAITSNNKEQQDLYSARIGVHAPDWIFLALAVVVRLPRR